MVENLTTATSQPAFRRRVAASVADIWRRCARRPRSPASDGIFGAPQPEFSAAIQRTRARISLLTLSRPLRGYDRQGHYRRKPARCHPTIVSGFTMTRTSDHRGHICRRVVQKKRSRQFSEGRGRFRLSTATCCRRASFKRGIRATVGEDADVIQQCGDQMKHESTVVTSRARRGGVSQAADLNILRV